MLDNTKNIFTTYRRFSIVFPVKNVEYSAKCKPMESEQLSKFS